jgi:hypothetical protein
LGEGFGFAIGDREEEDIRGEKSGCGGDVVDEETRILAFAVRVEILGEAGLQQGVEGRAVG